MFVDIESVPAIEIFPGVRIRTPYGKNLMLSYVEIEEGAVVSFHHHPHEQGGVVLSGRLELTIGGETRTLGPGEMYLIPPDTPHRAAAAGGRTVVMDVFSPVREDYAARTEQAAKLCRDGTAAEQRR
jgi:quercetin dioxygenase-like cupin family protein